MTARKTAEQAVAAASERFRVAFDNAPIGMGLVTPDGGWLQVNAAFCRLLGYTEEELLKLSLADLTVPGDATIQVDESEETRSETRYLRADGTPLWVAAEHDARARRRPGSPLYYVLQVEDIGDRKQTERELRRLADHDSLTGLLNRRGFMEGLRRELRRMERKGRVRRARGARPRQLQARQRHRRPPRRRPGAACDGGGAAPEAAGHRRDRAPAAATSSRRSCST